jgi:uncharacterized membrane protein YuzA (DUF378 family)
VITPHTLDLKNKHEIYKLLMISRFLFKFCDFNLKILIPLSCFMASFIPLALHSTLIELLFFTIPWSILFSMGTTFANSILIWQLTYFYLLCYYLNIKLRSINKQILLTLNSSTIRNNITQILIDLNWVHAEINDYNSNYWSKLLLQLCCLDTSIICLFVFNVLFGQMSIAIRTMFIYASLICLVILLVFLNSASYVAYEANKSYKLLNYLLLRYMKLKIISIPSQIKVYNK